MVVPVYNVLHSPFSKFLCRLFLAVSIAVMLIMCINGLLDMERHNQKQESYFVPNLHFSEAELTESNRILPARSQSRPIRPVRTTRTPVQVEGRGGDSQIRKLMDVVIVEEHHEVLPYWYKIAERQKEERGHQWTPYTLVHFDAHSDFAPPSYNPGAVLFRWPKTENDIRTLMQRNDVFIQAAASTGLIASLIWVWPGWKADEIIPHFGQHLSGVAQLGLFDYPISNSTEETEKGFCACLTNVTVDGVEKAVFKDPVGRQCIFAQPDMQPYTGLEAYCDFKTKLSIDYIREDLMLTSAQELVKTRNVILDIDEDFFGCEVHRETVGDTGLRWLHLEQINQLMEGVFCAKNAIQEGNLQGVIHSLLFSDCQPWSKGCLAPTSVDESVIEYTSCHEPAFVRKRMTRIHEFITSTLSREQSLTLEKLGFCLETSPLTSKVSIDNIPNYMVVCGVQPPESANSTIRHPTKRDILDSIANLRAVIGQFIQKCGLTTIARSARDGFVSRKSQPFIEDNLLNSLTNLLERSNIEYNIIHDLNLLVRDS